MHLFVLLNVQTKQCCVYYVQYLIFCCSCGQVVGAVSFYGGCSSLYASLLALVPLVVFIVFVLFVIYRTVGQDGPLMWRRNSVRRSAVQYKKVYKSSYFVRRNAAAAVVDAVFARGYWLERVDVEVDKTLMVCPWNSP